MSILDYAKEACKCQRNWNYEIAVPKDHLEYIVQCSEAMPSKQQLPCYDIFVSTNRKLNSQLFSVSFLSNNSGGEMFRNGQVNAPALLLFLRNQTEWEFPEDVQLNVGIAAGTAALAAQELGYKTGFNKCTQPESVYKILKNTANFDVADRANEFVLMLGIGHPKDNTDRNEVYLNNKMIKKPPALGPKQIYTTYFE